MGSNSDPSLRDLDFDYEDSVVKIIPTTSLQEVTVSETTVGPFERGKDFETRYWIADALVKAGYAAFREEDVLTYATLSKLHWRETKLSQGLQISALPEHFYPRLRRFLSTSRANARSSSDPMAATQHVQCVRLSQDIVNCRLRKIVSLAASSSRAATVTQVLSREERALFEKVRATVADWEKTILNVDPK